MLSDNGLSTCFIKDKPGFSSSPKSVPKIFLTVSSYTM